MNSVRRQISLLISWCLLATIFTFAQSKPADDATLIVTVVDPRGAAIRNALVQLEGLNKKAKSAETNRTGEARLTRLTPGIYRRPVTPLD